MSSVLSQLDTGIARLGYDDFELDILNLPKPLQNRLMEDLSEGSTADFRIEPNGERFLITKKDARLTVRKLVSYHNDAQGSEIRFEINQESDGTRRAIDLLPAFLDLTGGSDRVYAIDELDRSLHTLLLQSLLHSYLESVDENSRSQLLFTTHDVLLMDQKIFRRDEMWVTERDPTGCGSLIAFSDYKDIRLDKDIRKSYLQGRMGGIPKILLSGLSDEKVSVKAKGDST